MSAFVLFNLAMANLSCFWIHVYCIVLYLGAGDVLLGVGEVLVQGVSVPGDSLVLVGLGKIFQSESERETERYITKDRGRE